VHFTNGEFRDGEIMDSQCAKNASHAMMLKKKVWETRTRMIPWSRR
jgi:hypothetical protein